MNLSFTNSLALLNNNYGILLKIYFYKKIGKGKIFLNNFLDKTFYNSLLKILNFIKIKFNYLYKIIKNNNIYIKIYPNKFILKNSSITSSIFFNFFCLFYNIKLNNNLIIIGDIDKKGNFLYINDIYKKIKILDKDYFIIIPSKNCINNNILLDLKKSNLIFIKISNVFDLLDLFKIKY